MKWNLDITNGQARDLEGPAKYFAATKFISRFFSMYSTTAGARRRISYLIPG